MTQEEALRYLGKEAKALGSPTNNLSEGVDTKIKANLDKDGLGSTSETTFREGTETKHKDKKKDLPKQTTLDHIPSPSEEAFPQQSRVEKIVLEQDIPPLTREQAEDLEPLDHEKGFQKLEFFSAAEVLAFFRDDIRTGSFVLHPWQIEENEKIAQFPATTQKPLRYCLCAANGSGKDATIIAGNAIFFCLRYIKARVIITSAGGVQLTGQTETYIRDLAEAVNQKFGMPYFKVNQRYIRCKFSGSEIRMFATDEPGKAEGYHPFPDAPEPILVMIVNEAKSVPEEINQALKRCTVTHWLYVSSPGEPKGSFYWAFSNYDKLGGYSTRITSFQCISEKHRSLDTIEQDRLEFGEHSAIYRSKHLALFTSVDGECVIPEDSVNACLATKISPIGQDWEPSIGIDSAAGGDECVVTIVRGNRVHKEYFFREKDTTVSTEKIDRFLEDQKIAKTNEHIFADDGGVSKAITDGLARKGWRINRILNQKEAHNKRDFGNIGAENWFRVGRLIQLKLLDLSNLSEKTISQLKSRHYRVGEKNRIYLKKKSDERAEGFDSPDRGDAYVLALKGRTVEDFLGETSGDKASSPRHVVDLQTLIKQQMDEKYRHFTDQLNGSTKDQPRANMHLLNPDSWRTNQFEVPLQQIHSLSGRHTLSLSEIINSNLNK